MNNVIVLKCSFCEKTRKDRVKLVRSKIDRSKLICNECVSFMMGLLKEDKIKDKKEELPDDCA